MTTARERHVRESRIGLRAEISVDDRGMRDAKPEEQQTNKETPMGAIIDKVKGKAMKAEGRATGDKVRSTQGKAVEKKGKIKGKIDELRVRGKMKMQKGKAKRKATAARRTP